MLYEVITRESSSDDAARGHGGICTPDGMPARGGRPLPHERCAQPVRVLV